jgi:ABC-type spermidine/putrescine transport system permease subunit I
MVKPGPHDPAVREPLLQGAAPMAFLLVLFLYPVARFLLVSIEGGSLAHYDKALLDGLYLRVLIDTFRIALVVTAITLVLGYPLAWFLVSAPPRWATVGLVLLILPFWTSVLIRTYAWSVILGRNGLINAALLASGVIEDPLPLLNNEIGVLIGMVHVLLPYVVFPIYAVMRRQDPTLLLASSGLGASGFQTFTRVFLPLTVPGILAGTTLVFVLSLGFFITPAILGGGRVMMIAVLIEHQVRGLSNWPFAAALSAVLLAAALAMYGLLSVTLRARQG